MAGLLLFSLAAGVLAGALALVARTMQVEPRRSAALRRPPEIHPAERAARQHRRAARSSQDLYLESKFEKSA
jgi:hypothetical protein